MRKREAAVFKAGGWTHKVKGRRILLRKTGEWLPLKSVVPTGAKYAAEFIDQDQKFHTLRDDQVMEL